MSESDKPDAKDPPRFGEVRYYHLERTGLKDALIQLLQKAQSKGGAIALYSRDETQLQTIDKALWADGPPDGFMPHGLCIAAGSDGPLDGAQKQKLIDKNKADQQPILLINHPDLFDANQANIWFLLDQTPLADLTQNMGKADNPATLICRLFEGGDPTALQGARACWRVERDQASQLSYYQQSAGGGWVLAHSHPPA